MPNGIRLSLISLLAIIGILVFETTAIGKKKPKRRAARAKAVKKVTLTKAPLSLPFVFPTRIQTVSTTTPPVEANVPVFKATPKVQVLSGPTAPAAALAGQLLISEFRVRGPNGALDEFIEIYNNTNSAHTVAPTSGAGYGVAASDGINRCTIPTGRTIPAHAHYLCVNSGGYSLDSYPSGNNGTMGTVATGDATYTLDIPDNAGIALFNNNSGGASYSMGNRLDAVGSTAEADPLYREGAGYPAIAISPLNYSFYRDNCGKQGAVTTFGLCPSGGSVVDTDNNAADFIFVDTEGTPTAAGTRLGAPGPENLTSPIRRNAVMPVFLLDATVPDASLPNRQRDSTSDPANNSTFGTLEIRRRFVNKTGATITRLRFRIVDITTALAPGDIADLRARTSLSVSVGGVNDAVTCSPNPTPCVVNLQGTTVETPPLQPNGGGFNTSMSVGTVTVATPLGNNASINVRFLLGVQKTGRFKFYVNIEALP